MIHELSRQPLRVVEDSRTRQAVCGVGVKNEANCHSGAEGMIASLGQVAVPALFSWLRLEKLGRPL
jgi:hypothetical protein